MLIAETILSALLIKSPPLRKAEDAMIQFDSTGNGCFVERKSETKLLEPQVALADSMDRALAKDIGSVQQVKYVLTEKVPDALLVWIVVDEPEPNIRRRIYDKELALISEFPEIEFDFNLVASLGRQSEEIACGSELIYSRPD